MSCLSSYGIKIYYNHKEVELKIEERIKEKKITNLRIKIHSYLYAYMYILPCIKETLQRENLQINNDLITRFKHTTQYHEQWHFQ